MEQRTFAGSVPTGVARCGLTDARHSEPAWTALAKGLTYHNCAFNMEDVHAHVPPDEPQPPYTKTNKPVAARMNTLMDVIS
jgi:hypothetical protein